MFLSCLMIRCPPRSTRSATLVPYPPLVRSRCIRAQQPFYRLAYGGDMLKVDPALRLVEKAQIWTLEEELQDFPSFDLAAREPGIDITLGKTVEIERRSLRFQ